MPASPRVAVVGIGSAVLIALSIPMVAGVIATIHMEARNARAETRARFEQDLRSIREFGLRFDRFPNEEDGDFWRTVSDDLIGVTGKYAVMGDGFALHRLPKVVVAALQSYRRDGGRSLDVAVFEESGELSDVLGDSGGQGVAVALTSGEVFIVRDEMPLAKLRPLLTRDKAVQADTRKMLTIYALK